MEWSLAGAMLTKKQLAPAVEYEQNRASAIAAHYAEHGLVPPPAVGRAIIGATENLDEVTEGDGRSSVRFRGPVRLATYAATEAECLEQARALVDAYGDRANFDLAQPARAGAAAAGVRARGTVVERGLPAADPRPVPGGGDAARRAPRSARRPVPISRYGTGSARRAMRLDLHYGMEKLQQSGFFTITAEPGAGKSVLTGALAFNAARRGEPTIILDPSGPLARLATMPELKGSSRVLDLTASEPGTLSPYQLVPEPRPKTTSFEDGTPNELEYPAGGAAGRRGAAAADVRRAADVAARPRC